MKTLILSLSLFAATFALAHGEDKAGPHGGYVRMPGAYHTELVPLGKNQLKVYLLDIHWKNPSTKNSFVEVIYNAKISTQCQAQEEESFFLCDLPTTANLLIKGQLLLNSQREGQKGNQAVYELPLKLIPR